MGHPLLDAWFQTKSTAERLMIVRRLVDEGVDLNGGTGEGFGMLPRACAEKSLPLVKALVGAGVDVNRPSLYDGAPLAAAAWAESLLICQYLIDRGALPDATNEEGVSALEMTLYRHPGIARLLIEAGANPNAPDHEGAPPVVVCAQHGKVSTLRALLQKGALPDAVDADGETALMLACGRRRESALPMVNLLLKFGADPNQATPSGWTALMSAAHMPLPNPQVVKRLLRAGADPMREALDPDTGRRVRALHLAQSKVGANHQVADVLLQAERACLAQATAASRPSKPRARL